MSINLSKGQKVAIPMPKFVIGLGWTKNQSTTGQDFDLDGSAFILNGAGKLTKSENFVFYNNLKSPDGAVEHTGDNRTGEGEGDDEKILIDLSKLDAAEERISIIVTIHDAATRRQNFGQVSKAYIRVCDEAGTELMKFDLEEDFSSETAVEFGAIYKKDDVWKFNASGVGHKEGLQKYVDSYS